jgi:hypothetical protein
LEKDSRVIRIDRHQFANVENLANDFDGLFDCLVPVRAGSQELLDFSRIHMHEHRASGLKFEMSEWPDPDAVIEAYIEWYQPSNEDLVYDLGPGCGITSFALSNMARSVIAIESDARLRVILERNVERLGMTNVSVLRDAWTNLADLIKARGKPAYCKLNLDQIPIEFLQKDAEAWNGLGISFAGRSMSGGMRERFAGFFKDNGFETDSNPQLGVVRARPTTDAIP